ESPEELARQYKKYQNAAKFDYNSEEVFCVCRKPDHGELMIACDGCEDWFHFKCMNLNAKYSKLVSKFYCKFCHWKGKGTTKWKRKCRLDWCFEPIRTNSKYCSENHGITYMREKLVGRNDSTADLKPSTIKEVLKHTETHQALLHLGALFPELEEVVQFKQTKDISRFPESVREELASINTKLGVLDNSIELYNRKTEYLVLLKEIVKGINDKLTDKNEEKVTSKKKTRQKKIDICLYDKSLNEVKGDAAPFKSILEELTKNSELETTFTDLIQKKLTDETDQDWFENKLCIQDKRKCPRHNGWWNLVNDNLTKKLNELRSRVEKVEKEKEDILRKYSIDIYEN
ncbi:uncharacterized protein CANTADRAFT_39182, partial [Suhomyces tanzawaensis NRRL Y-17324]